MITKIYQWSLDILFPLQCIACGKPDALLCSVCYAGLPIRTMRINRPAAHVDFAVVCSDYDHPIISAVIKGFKFEGLQALALPLADVLHRCVPLIPGRVDSLVAVPLHKRRERMRGYNQSALLAEKLSQKIELPVDRNLIRVRYTSSQSKLDHAQRHKNMRNAFRYAGERAPKYALLIDDVATTFSTLDAAAGELKKHGARTVGALVIAQSKQIS